MRFFRRHAEQWRRKASTSSCTEVPLIALRNGYVLRVSEENPALASALDLGCGSGDLVCELARRGLRAVGVDFAGEMIDLCRQRAGEENLSRAEFHLSSVFDYATEETFNLVSALGLIEYISPEELKLFANRLASLTSPAAHLVMGSRNRLFNAFSLNEFTKLEIRLGTLTALMEESLAIATAENEEECLGRLSEIETELPAFEKHPATGIEVSVRHQYCPSTLIRLLSEHGFRAVGIQPLHYHGLPPRLGRDHPELHAAISGLVEETAASCLPRFPFSSTFLVHAVKE